MDELFKKFQDDNQQQNGGTDCLSQFIQHWKDLSDAERKAIGELDDLRAKLLAKETEISLLRADINMLAADRDNKIVDVEELSSQLSKLREENDCSLATIQSIETELEDLRLKNAHLREDLLKKSEYLSNLELEKARNDKTVNDEKIRSLEVQIKSLEKEKHDLTEEHEAIEVEREEELRALQNALDDALEQKIKIKTKYEHEIQNLKTACSAQEQQLMDDFEWKLRQVEQSWKKKLTDKERQSEDKLSNLKSQIEREIAAEREKIKEDRIQVNQQMRQVSHLKSYEVEVVQLRGLTHEQQKALRAAARQIEHLKFSEKVCQDELCTVRTLLEKQKAHLQVVQGTHQRRLEVQEENIQAKLDKQRNELNSKWEDRMRGECSRLKQDLCKLHIEEKHLAVESMKLQKEQELSTARQAWERLRKDLLHEISKLKDTITEKESTCHREMERLTTLSDREIWELRRIIDKTTNNYVDEISQLQEIHETQMESLQKRYDEAVEKLNELEKALKQSEEMSINQNNQDEPKYITSNDRLDVVVQENQVNKSDSGCGDESTDSEREEPAASDECSEEDDDEEEDEELAFKSCCEPLEVNTGLTEEQAATPDGGDEAVVSHLREEVANLQGSIEKLTSTLNTTTTESSPCPLSCSSLSVSENNSVASSEVTETDDDEEDEDDDDNGKEDDAHSVNHEKE